MRNLNARNQDPDELWKLLRDHLERFQPISPAEEKLVMNIAADQWRFNLALRAIGENPATPPPIAKLGPYETCRALALAHSLRMLEIHRYARARRHPARP